MRYRTIDVRIWGDKKFRSLSPLQPSGQALFLYLLTNPHTNSIPGLYRAGAAAMAEELGWLTEGFREALEEALQQGLVKADLKARVIFIPNAIKYNKPQSVNVVKSWSSHWDEIPECELKTLAYQHLKAFLEGLHVSYLKAFFKAIAKPSLIQEQDQEQEQEQEQLKTCQVANATGRLADENQLAKNIKDLFTYWQKVMNHPKAKLDDKRKRFIKQALKSYSIEDLQRAIDGCASSSHHMGKNDNKTRYDAIDLIFRDADHIEGFINRLKNPNASNISAVTVPTPPDDVFAGAT